MACLRPFRLHPAPIRRNMLYPPPILNPSVFLTASTSPTYANAWDRRRYAPIKSLTSGPSGSRRALAWHRFQKFGFWSKEKAGGEDLFIGRASLVYGLGNVAKKLFEFKFAVGNGCGWT